MIVGMRDCQLRLYLFNKKNNSIQIMETVLTIQIEELTRLQEEEHQQLLGLVRENDDLLSLVKECRFFFN